MSGSPPRPPPCRPAAAAAAVALLLSPAAAAAQAQAAPADPERLMFPDLDRQPEAAVALARKADAARRRGDFEGAAGLYAQAAAAAPGYAPFVRRQCGAEIARERWDEALALCRKAVEIEEAPENLLGAAVALSRFEAGALPSEDAAEVRRLIERAHARDDARSRTAACEVVAMSGTMALSECSRGPFGELDPETMRIATAAAEAARRERTARSEAQLREALRVLGALAGIVGLVFAAGALHRRLAGPPDPPRRLWRARWLLGGDRLVVVERRELCEAAALEALIPRLLALGKDRIGEVERKVVDQGDALRVTLHAAGRRYRATLQRAGARTGAGPLLEALDQLLEDAGAKGRLHEIIAVNMGEERLVVGYAIPLQVTLLRRYGLLGEPFSLPAGEALGMPFQRGSRVHFHANGRIAEAVLARVHRVRGVPCAAGVAVRLQEGGGLASATLGAEHAWGGVRFPAGSRVEFHEGRAVPRRITPASACAAPGITLPAESVVELDEAGAITRATLGAEASLEGVPCAAGTALRFRAGLGFRFDVEPGGPYRGG